MLFLNSGLTIDRIEGFVVIDGQRRFALESFEEYNKAVETLNRLGKQVTYENIVSEIEKERKRKYKKLGLEDMEIEQTEDQENAENQENTENTENTDQGDVTNS